MPWPAVEQVVQVAAQLRVAARPGAARCRASGAGPGRSWHRIASKTPRCAGVSQPCAAGWTACAYTHAALGADVATACAVNESRSTRCPPVTASTRAGRSLSITLRRVGTLWRQTSLTPPRGSTVTDAEFPSHRCGAAMTQTPVSDPTSDPITTVPAEVLRDLHRRMVRIRLFEEEAGKLMEGGRMPGFLHLYVGQEAIAAGVMATLRDRRRDHLDPPRPRARRRQGRRPALHVRRAVRQDHRLLQGPRRQHAHQRPEHRHARRERHRRRRHPARRGRGAGGVLQGPGLGGGAVLRRRRHRTSAPSTSRRTWPPCCTCRSCSSARTTAMPSSPRRPSTCCSRTSPTAPPPTACRARSSTAWTPSRSTSPPRSWSSGPGPASGPSLLEAKTYRYYDHQGVKGLRTLYRTQEEIDDLEGAGRDRARSRPVWSPRTSSSVEECQAVWRETGDEIVEAIKFGEDSPDPDPADLLDNVYTV